MFNAVGFCGSSCCFPVVGSKVVDRGKVCGYACLGGCRGCTTAVLGIPIFEYGFGKIPSSRVFLTCRNHATWGFNSNFYRKRIYISISGQILLDPVLLRSNPHGFGTRFGAHGDLPVRARHPKLAQRTGKCTSICRCIFVPCPP